jgi:hypothetical protein
VAVNLNNLALLLLAEKRMVEAEPLMKRSLAIRERTFGPDHPDVAIGLYNLARIIQNLNRDEESEPLNYRALELLLRFIRNDGQAHQHFKVVQINYIRLLQRLG